MEQRKPFKNIYFYIQSIGLLPLFFVSLANNYATEVQTIKFALLLGLLCVCFEIFHRIVRKRYILMFGVSTLTLLEFAFLKLIFYNSLFLISNTVFLGILLFLNLVIVRSARVFLYRNRSRNRSKRDRVIMDNVIHEFMYMSRLLLYGLSFYLVLTILFNTYGRKLYPDIYEFLNYRLNLILISVYFIYECIRIILLNMILSKETWLPIISESKESKDIIGRIEKQESLRSGNKYLHPHLRIIIMCKNKIYLQQGYDKKSFSGLCLDTPISQDLLYGETFDNAILKKAMNNVVAVPKDCTPRKIMTTKFKNDSFNRKIVLYILTVPDESCVINKPRGGKFWTPDQIDSEINSNALSECFKQEYEFIKNTVLFAWNFIEKGEDE